MRTVILDETYTFKPKDNKTNFIVEFKLDRDFDALEFETMYTPKQIDDLEYSKKMLEEAIPKYISPELLEKGVDLQRYLPLVNHITMSLDYNGKYLGCAHRHPNVQTHFISEKSSSLGFFMQKAEKGNWRVVINIHHNAGSDVKYHLKISGIEGESL